MHFGIHPEDHKKNISESHTLLKCKRSISRSSDEREKIDYFEKFSLSFNNSSSLHFIFNCTRIREHKGEFQLLFLTDLSDGFFSSALKLCDNMHISAVQREIVNHGLSDLLILFNFNMLCQPPSSRLRIMKVLHPLLAGLSPVFISYCESNCVTDSDK